MKYCSRNNIFARMYNTTKLYQHRMYTEFNTWKEILQQPEMWRETYDIVCSRKAEIESFVKKYVAEGYEIILTGAGTSAYIGDALQWVLSDTLLKGAKAIATTDIITEAESLFNKESKVLLVSFARSGNSPESVGAINLVNKVAGEAAHIFITCNANGEMAKMADGTENILLVLLPAKTNDLSLAMTSSYSSMYLACAMIANIEKIEEHKSQVEAVAAATAEALPKYTEAIKAMAERDFNRAVFLGSGELMGVAEESRLKLQELTDGTVMCAFDSFLGFRHGPKAVINKDTLLVYLLSENPATQRYEYDLIRQIKANNDITGYVAVSQSEPTVGAEYFDLNVVIGVPAEVKRCYKSVSYIFVAQLLGFYKALDLKRSPDNPSVSGNISRVVEGVTIYE